MHYTINKKNIKQSVQNLSVFFKNKGYDLPRNIFLEAFSKSLFLKNWNTLEGLLSKPTVIEHIPTKKVYMIEIQCDLNESEILKKVKQSFFEGKCEANIDNYIHLEKTSHLEISFPNKNDNFLTAMFILASSLKTHNVTRFDLLRIVFEKENLLDAVKLNFNHNK